MSYDKLRRMRGRDKGNTLDIIADQQEGAATVANEIFGSEEAAPQRSLRPREDGSMSYGPITLTETGIVWPENRAVSEELFAGLGRQLLRLHGSIQWMIGDWLVYGDNHRWGETIQRIAEETEREVSTIYVYKSVAAKVLIRIKDLSFGHHQVVAPEEPQQQVYWLEQAQENEWTVAQLRKAMSGKQSVRPNRFQREVNKIVSAVTFAKKYSDHKAEIIQVLEEALAELKNA